MLIYMEGYRYQGVLLSRKGTTLGIGISDQSERANSKVHVGSKRAGESATVTPLGQSPRIVPEDLLALWP